MVPLASIRHVSEVSLSSQTLKARARQSIFSSAETPKR